MADATGAITKLLAEAHEGREGALDEVMALVYEDLRRIARHQIARRRGIDRAVSLEPVELVSEAYLKLIKQRNRYDSRGHFFAIATTVMLRVLMDHHRARGRGKRGGDHLRVSLSKVDHHLAGEAAFEVPLLVDALERLEVLSPRTAEVTKLRILWGLGASEIAKTLELSVSTVEREWRFARHWLTAELQDPPASPPLPST